jgi:hypothetical protein
MMLHVGCDSHALRVRAGGGEVLEGGIYQEICLFISFIPNSKKPMWKAVVAVTAICVSYFYVLLS